MRVAVTSAQGQIRTRMQDRVQIKQMSVRRKRYLLLRRASRWRVLVFSNGIPLSMQVAGSTSVSAKEIAIYRALVAPRGVRIQRW